ncbi:MAG: prepilin-type N-terminal cleavage/methylation domain-containing protein [Desulfobacterota bacterium]|nr:prepilin-type N-terminal cleavage/methylation domain-containing protein [Thermodesulfobacteriota bacterium]
MEERGFTLIEIIILIVILGILSAIVIPRYLDLSRSSEKAVAEQLVGSMRSALTLYYSNWVAKQKGTLKNFRDNISIPNFVKVAGDAMGLTGNETLVLERHMTSRFVNDQPSSIKDYAQDGSGRHLRFVFKNGAILDIYYDREKPAIDAVFTGF